MDVRTGGGKIQDAVKMRKEAARTNTRRAGLMYLSRRATKQAEVNVGLGW